MADEITGPVELTIAQALTAAGVRYMRAHKAPDGVKIIDFYLPDTGVYIECKRTDASWTYNQVISCDNVIVVEGLGAAKQFARMVRAAAREPEPRADVSLWLTDGVFKVSGDDERCKEALAAILRLGKQEKTATATYHLGTYTVELKSGF